MMVTTKKIVRIKSYVPFFKSGTVSLLLFLNMALVVFGYGLAVLTAKASVGPMAIVKPIVLVLSMYYVLKKKKNLKFSPVFSSGQVPLIFSGFVILSVFWSEEMAKSFYNAATFVFPMIYVYISVDLLIRKYGMQETMMLFHKMLILTFSIPLIAYLITTPSLADTNIYGYDEESGQAFYSNHYGWASVILILAIIGIYKHIKLNFFAHLIAIIAILLSTYLLLISGSRSSMVSLALAIVVMLVRFKGISFYYKAFIVIFSMVGISYLLADPESGLNVAINRTEIQREQGEARVDISNVMFSRFEEKPELWIRGLGFYNHKFLQNSPVSLKAYHNSYWEILFGLGLPLFMVFLYFMLFRPMLNYAFYFSKWVLVFPPIVIIPYFESNITAGQFLFFPWFTFMLLLNVKKKYWKY